MTRNRSLTDDLRNDLVDELADIRAIITRQRKLEEAALTLLGFDPDNDDDDEPPASSGATFTADDARHHDERQTKPAKKRGGGKRANLTDDQVRTIRRLVGDGASRAEVGDTYNLSRQTISNIVAGKGCYGEIA